VRLVLTLPCSTSSCPQVNYTEKMNALMDAITLHANGGKTIVFVNTKVRESAGVCSRGKEGRLEGEREVPF